MLVTLKSPELPLMLLRDVFPVTSPDNSEVIRVKVPPDRIPLFPVPPFQI